MALGDPALLDAPRDIASRKQRRDGLAVDVDTGMEFNLGAPETRDTCLLLNRMEIDFDGDLKVTNIVSCTREQANRTADRRVNARNRKARIRAGY